jgi:hypothetical protein
MCGKIKLTEKHAVRTRKIVMCMCVFIAVSMSLGILMLRTTKMPLYKLEYVNLDEQCGTKVHISSLHTTLTFQLNLDQCTYYSSVDMTV